MNKIPFYSDCVSWPGSSECLNAIKDSGISVDWAEFRNQTDCAAFREQIFCGKQLDRCVSLLKVPGKQIYFFIWSGIEHVFASSDTMDALEKEVAQYYQSNPDGDWYVISVD